MSHTPLFKSLRRAIRLAFEANRKGAPPVEELIGRDSQRAVSRREMMKIGAVSAVGLGFLQSCETTGRRERSSPPPEPLQSTRAGARVAIVGGGIAGLNAAWELKKTGIAATIYEASPRTGGRMFTGKDIVGPGFTTELGGEFIDTSHAEVLRLAREFGLELIDTQAESEKDLVREAYFFERNHRRESEVVEEFRPLAARIARDLASLEETIDYEHDGGAGTFDRTSIAAYFDSIGAAGWIRTLLDVAYVTEYGLECSEQSSLNLLQLISTDLSNDRFEAFGESDERYKIKGGNDLIPSALAALVKDDIMIEHRLEAIRSRDEGFTLTFSVPHAANQTVKADFVLLALPFSILRTVEMDLELPPAQKKAIAELGYGTNSKIFAGFRERPWRANGYSGNIFTDEGFQLAWDSTRGQDGDGGGLTFYGGGKHGLEMGNGTPLVQVTAIIPAIGKAFPGASVAFTEKTQRFHWPTHLFTRGSYSVYKTGQWTTIAGAEGLSTGNLFFAGEHCSQEFQGYMNGGAETGKRAAEGILERMSVGIRKAG